MKSSGKERSFGKGAKCLVVDGYNVIARLKRTALTAVDDLETARQYLIEALSEYAAFSGDYVVLVFDAYTTKDPEVDEFVAGIRVLYTYQQETADSRIERLVYELRDSYREITVATSDNFEQQVAFGGGALRISANELLRRLRETKHQIQKTVIESRVKDSADPRRRVGDLIRQDIAKILEKWRRQ